ncbi:MAG TPA: ABC transporter ATP-binding protein [Anaerolineales bacterium]|nr:ABC transporter ATP-binding protein [Anaerolineales bacterium]
MLNVKNLRVHYGAFAALQDVSLTIEEGRIVSIVGANGAGKTTLINAISGLLRPVSGDITFEGQNLLRLEGYAIASMGVAQVPEGRKLFGDMTVYENLLMGSYSSRAKPEREKSLEMVYDLFPILKSRSNQLARTLSGGEQQMLAVGRAVMMRPRLMMLDEPSLGLAPMVVQNIFEVILRLKAAGQTIMLVEQNVRQSLQISDYAYVLETGQVVLNGTGREVLENDHTRKAYLGI